MDEIKIISEKLRQNIGLVIKGKDDVIDKILICLFCAGHILLEDIPGTGKTTLVKTLAKSVDVSYKRVQFTPDLLPFDLTGANIYNQKDGDFSFRQGPVFTNIMLADEINRATPRTQSSLLECMEEGQVTVDGTTHILPQPFLVVATQNPVEIQGTFPLPEAQLDRFFMCLKMGYPDLSSEAEILNSFILQNPLQNITPVLSQDEILKAQQIVRTVTVSPSISEYILQIVTATRNDDKIRLGVSPRGSLALMRAAQAVAAMDSRDYVIPDDVKKICADVLAHRMLCKRQNLTENSGVAKEILRQIITSIPVPIEN